MQAHQILSALALVAFFGNATAQTLVRSIPGPAANAQFGKACISIPDQNSDGFKDVLVGAPGFNAGRGAIYCISGLYLASGNGAQILWSLAPVVNPDDNFGFALADVGDVTGDNVHDFLVGQPGSDFSTNMNAGAVRLVHGSSHTIVSLITGEGGGGGLLGCAIAVCGDLNTNGSADVVIGAPNNSGEKGKVHVVDGFKLTQSVGVTQTGFVLASFGGSNFFDHLGSSVASGADLTGDGIAEIVAGVPGYDNTGAIDSGRVVVYDTVANQTYSVASFFAGEAMGSAVSMGHDYDGDGVADIVVGAPNAPNGSAFEVGRAVVLSGARVIAQTPPYEIYTFPGGSVTPPVNHTDPEPNFHLGAAVQACADLNNDGVGEIIVSAPDFFTQSFSGWSFKGLVKVFSGATGEQLVGFSGASTDKLGDGLGGAIDDLDGDGFPEFAVAGSLSDVGGTDSGVLKCHRLFPVATITYCVGKLNSLGCTPSIGFSGVPSASSSSPFLVTASNFVNQKNGLLFYGHAPAAVPFQGGTKCVANPTIRTIVQNSGGATSGSSCTGTYSFDFNAHIASGIDPTLVAGAEVYAQYWSRDPQTASHTSLSNAVRFLIHP